MQHQQCLLHYSVFLYLLSHCNHKTPLHQCLLRYLGFLYLLIRYIPETHSNQCLLRCLVLYMICPFFLQDIYIRLFYHN
jgi:hypothetical protein